MLSTSVAIISPASIGGGQYTFNLHFASSSVAKFLRVGDYVESAISGDRYEIVTWATSPSDFTSSTQVTANSVDNDVTPTQDVGFNSSAYTPGQVDVRPAVLTDGAIGNITVYSGQNFEYTLQGGWNDLIQANKAQIDDSIVDSSGKEFRITHLEVDLFNSPFRVTEVVKEGVSPISGPASLYRATTNLGLFQGKPISDPARTVVRNRDDFNIDAKLAELEAGGGGSGSEISSTMPNNSGSTILKATPVRSAAGEATNSIDLSVEGDATSIIGVAAADIINGASGSVITSGRVTDITTTAGLDDLLWVSKSGTLTNTPPEIGVGGFVAGDFVVMMGVVVKNETDAGKKDLIVHRQIVGQL